MRQTLLQIGRFLFRNRGLLGIPIFIFAAFLGAPNWTSLIYGLLLLILGETIRILSVAYAGPATRSSKINAKILVTSGPYAHVRNPIYIGNFFIGFGGIVMLSGWLWWYIAVFVILFWSYYGLIVIAEEDFLRKEFGSSYIEYTKRVRRFIPQLIPYREGIQVHPDYGMAFRSEKSTFMVLVLILIVGLAKVLTG